MSEDRSMRPRRGPLALAGLGSFAVLLVASLLVLLTPVCWLGEIPSSFRWHIGWAGLAPALLLLLARRRRLFLPALLLAAWHLWPGLSLYLLDRSGPDDAPGLEVAAANVYWGNEDPASFLAWVRETRPDLVVVLELSYGFKTAVDAALEDYPHRLIAPGLGDASWGEKTIGIAILSKRPFVHARSVDLDPDGFPVLEATLELDGRALIVRAVHLPPPDGSRLTARRNAMLRDLAEDLQWDERCVLLGDLNTTSGSWTFRKLLHDTGLSDTRHGFGRLPTWRAETPLCGLWICIDHILAGLALAASQRGTSALPGSDHRAATARLHFRERSALRP